MLRVPSKELASINDQSIGVCFHNVKGFKQFIRYKYLRKFANDNTMTNEGLNIPESVADFIQGRTPKTIGARYAEHITGLRRWQTC